jgi:hypothetical protein
MVLSVLGGPFGAVPAGPVPRRLSGGQTGPGREADRTAGRGQAGEYRAVVPDPKPSVLKKLFALSRNVCAYRGCEERMADPKWPSVQGRVAHIRGDRPGSARYDSSMTDEQRRAFENLILLCPNDHALIDELERDAHPPELLEQ